MLNTYDNFTLNSIFGRNFELRVQISYVLNIVPYGIYMNMSSLCLTKAHPGPIIHVSIPNKQNMHKVTKL